MIDKLSVSRVINAELKDCHALVSDIEGYETWVSDLKEVDIKNRDDEGRVTEATFRVAAMVGVLAIRLHTTTLTLPQLFAGNW